MQLTKAQELHVQYSSYQIRDTQQTDTPNGNILLFKKKNLIQVRYQTEVFSSLSKAITFQEPFGDSFKYSEKHLGFLFALGLFFQYLCKNLIKKFAFLNTEKFKEKCGR